MNLLLLNVFSVASQFRYMCTILLKTNICSILETASWHVRTSEPKMHLSVCA